MSKEEKEKDQGPKDQGEPPEIRGDWREPKKPKKSKFELPPPPPPAEGPDPRAGKMYLRWL